GKGIASASAGAVEISLAALHISYCGDGVAHTYLASCLRSSITVEGVSVGSCGRGLVFTGARVDAQDHVNLQKVRVQGCIGNGIHVDHSMERSSSMWDPDMEIIQNGGDGICFTPLMTDSVLFGCKRSLTTSSNGGHGINCSPVAVRSKVAFEFSAIRGVHHTSGAGLAFSGSYTNSSCDIIAHEAEEAFNQTGVRVNPVCENARINVSLAGINANGNAMHGFQIAPTGTGVCNLRLERCSASHNAAGAGAWGVFPADMAASFQAVDCTFENNAGAGMRTDGAVDVVARNCVYSNNMGSGLLGVTGPKEVSVIGCQFSTNAPHGFMFEAAGSGATSMGCFRVDSSVFRRSGVAGIMIASCRGGEIVRCTATSGTIGVFLTGGATGVAIENCTVANNSGAGFSVAGSGNLLLRNNARANGSEPSASYAIAAGNTVGPVVTAATIASNTNPHANYAY
ncbi:MAG: right-handed parallel beta-helix repeat-containing protein, partial [Planctomycetota bacterium]|nr:right-handed parallel beta-helix repeat-containing protein [Planctomycetota bacterium]